MASSLRVSPSKSNKKVHYRQGNLFNLKGVVVIEEIERNDRSLRSDQVDKEEKLRILKSLSKKKPSTKVITDTGIGRTIRRLSKHEDADLSGAAKKVYDLWRREVERREELSARGPLEVKCDLGTNNWRDRARRLLAEAVRGQEGFSGIVTKVEKEVFDLNAHLVNNAYKRSVRKLVFALKHKEDLRNGLRKGSLTVQRFVRQNRD